MAVLSLLLIQVGQLSVTGNIISTYRYYWLTPLGNLPRNCVDRLTDWLDMILIILTWPLNLKTNKQKKLLSQNCLSVVSMLFDWSVQVLIGRKWQANRFAIKFGEVVASVQLIRIYRVSTFKILNRYLILTLQILRQSGKDVKVRFPNFPQTFCIL